MLSRLCPRPTIPLAFTFAYGLTRSCMRFKPLLRGEAPEGDLDSVALCHGEHYVGELRHIAPTSGMIYIDGDTSMSPGTWEAVMRAS